MGEAPRSKPCDGRPWAACNGGDILSSLISRLSIALAFAVAGLTLPAPAWAAGILSPGPALAAAPAIAGSAVKPIPVSDNDYFTFHLCNKSNVDIAVAVSHQMAPDDDRFMVSGWFIVNRGDCQDLGPYAKGWFYFYGEQHNSGRLYWGSDDIKLCVKYPGPFDRINEANYTCKGSEKLKGFYSVEIGQDDDTYSFTMH